MRIVIDRAVCESNGYCEAIAPDVFRINDDDLLDVLVDDVPEIRQDDVRRAQRGCPKQAIRLEDD